MPGHIFVGFEGLQGYCRGFEGLPGPALMILKDSVALTNFQAPVVLVSKDCAWHFRVPSRQYKGTRQGSCLLHNGNDFEKRNVRCLRLRCKAMCQGPRLQCNATLYVCKELSSCGRGNFAANIKNRGSCSTGSRHWNVLVPGLFIDM
eukprot:1138728-Pelagomonas_calceolata.AAC.5